MLFCFLKCSYQRDDVAFFTRKIFWYFRELLWNIGGPFLRLSHIAEFRCYRFSIARVQFQVDEVRILKVWFYHDFLRFCRFCFETSQSLKMVFGRIWRIWWIFFVGSSKEFFFFFLNSYILWFRFGWHLWTCNFALVTRSGRLKLYFKFKFVCLTQVFFYRFFLIFYSNFYWFPIF